MQLYFTIAILSNIVTLTLYCEHNSVILNLNLHCVTINLHNHNLIYCYYKEIEAFCLYLADTSCCHLL